MNIGKSTGSTGGTESTGGSSSKKTDSKSVSKPENAPIEHVKQFKDAFDKQKKSNVFDLIKLAKDQVAEAASKLKPGAESKGKPTKEGQTRQESEKADKVLQPVQPKSEDRQPGKDRHQGQGEGIENKGKINIEEPRDTEYLKAKHKEGSEPPLIPNQIQSSITNPLGSPSPVGVQQSVPSSGVKEMAELASAMLNKMMISDASSPTGQAVRMSFGDANPNLKDVVVVIKKEGDALNVQFNTTQNAEAQKYITLNEGSLRENLQKEFPDLKDIRIDIPDNRKDDSQGRSRNKYVPENEEEQQP